MQARTRSLLIAIVIVTVSMIGAVSLQESLRFQWHVFIVPIWSPIFLVIMLQGGPHGASGGPAASWS